MKRSFAAALLFSLLFAGRAAMGQEAKEVDDVARSAARKLGYDGLAALDAGDYPTALEKFDKAYAVLRVPTLGLYSGRALEKLGRLVEASERYQEVSRLALPDLDRALHQKAQEDARAALGALLPRLAHLVVMVIPNTPDVELTIDHHAVPAPLFGTDLPLDPGTRRIRAHRGEESAEREIQLGEGQSQRVELRLALTSSPTLPTPMPVATTPSPAPPLPPQPPPNDSTSQSGSGLRTAAWVGFGIGVAGVAFGAVVGGIAAKQNSDLDRVCKDNVCPSTSSDDVGTYRRDRVLSTTGFVVGAVGLATGGVLLWLAPAKQSSSLRAWLGPKGMSFAGSF